MNTKNKAMLAVMAGNVIFGFSFLFSKLALEYTEPTMLIAVRFTVAFLVLNLIVFLSPRREFSLKGKPLRTVLLMALFQPIIYFPAENYGIVYTSSAFAGVIIAVIPIAGVIFDVLLMHSKVSLRQVLCAIFSVGGVALTTIGAKDMSASGKGTVLLLIAVIAGSLFYALSTKSSEHYSALERTYIMFGCGSVFYIIMSLIQYRSGWGAAFHKAAVQPVFWVSIIYLAVVSSVLAFLLLNYGSSYISVSQGTLFANLTTIISIFAGVLILGESFTLPQFIGTAVILGSVYFASAEKIRSIC